MSENQEKAAMADRSSGLAYDLFFRRQPLLAPLVTRNFDLEAANRVASALRQLVIPNNSVRLFLPLITAESSGCRWP